MKFFDVKKNNKGFTVLFAVIVSSLILAIGLSIGNITLKQIRISSLGRESQIAFYAADSGSECVMYYDLIEEAFATSSTSISYPGPITCFDKEIMIIGVEETSNAATTTIRVEDPDAELCATIEIGKYDGDGDGYSEKTTILSRGNNVCGSGNMRLLERGIRIKY